MNIIYKFKRNIVAVAFFAMSSVAYSIPLQLIDEPLFLNQSVPPALAITFDDSGSMAFGWMPDARDFDFDKHSFASSDYNTIYFNPNLDYSPPAKADGTLLPDANFNNAEIDGYDIYNVTNMLPTDLTTDYRPFHNIQHFRPASFYILGAASAGRTNAKNKAFYYTWNGSANPTLTQLRDNDADYIRHDVVSNPEMQNFANWYTYYNTRSKLAKAAVSHAFVNFGANFKVDWQQLNDKRFDAVGRIANMKSFSGAHRTNFYDWLYNVRTGGSTPLRSATISAGELFKQGSSATDINSPYYDVSYGQELTCQQNFHIAISDGDWQFEAGTSSNTYSDAAGTTFSASGVQNYPSSPTSGPGAMYLDSVSDTFSDGISETIADIAMYYWGNDLKPSLTNNVPTFIDDYTDSIGNTIVLNQGDDWLDNDELFWNPKNDPADWQHMVNYNVGLGVQGNLDQAIDLPGIRDGSLQWPTGVFNICLKGDGVTRVHCKIESCYDAANNLVDCDLDEPPSGPIVKCQYFDRGVNAIVIFPCIDRIVTRIIKSKERVDDVWHASLNSRGNYFNAQNPQELSTALYDIITNVIERQGQASATSISSSVISSKTLAYRTGYDTSDWSGFIVASQVNSDGTAGPVQWDASCKLTGGLCTTMNGNPNVVATNNDITRNIFTYDSVTKLQHSFDVANMSAAENNKILNSNYYTNATLPFTADDVIQYVRGDRLQEKQHGGQFRNRRSLLGDVIHSQAKIIRGPAASYNDNYWSAGTPERLAADNNNGYTQFRALHKDRDNILLVGANDGMLHAFDAGVNTNNGGHEYWAYIPSESLDGISELANPSYNHQTYVDAVPFVSDSFINGGWSTVALGGMRHGGKLFYALDLGVDPKSAPTVLWEFTDQDDSDMGYSYSGGVIARVVAPSGPSSVQSKWVAFVPNGYDSSTNKSAMYAIDLETGSVLHEWNSNLGDATTPNGMGSAVVADFVVYDENDTSITYYGADQGADFVYAGDLHGNLYRFDVSDIFSGSSVSMPDIIYDGTPDRSITAAPRLFTPEDGSQNVIVTFGTGKYIELPDRVITGSSLQYLFGIKDSNQPITTPYTLNDTRFVEQFITTSGNFRNLTENAVASTNSWKVELPVLGERLINEFGRNNQSKMLIAGTIIPNGSDPCLPGGQSWLMLIDPRTGGQLMGGSVLNGGNSDGMLIGDIVTGISLLSTPGGNETVINIDSAGGSPGNIDPDLQIDLNLGEKWRRRSWHRIMF